jgi:hypothetical protein
LLVKAAKMVPASSIPANARWLFVVGIITFRPVKNAQERKVVPN